MGLAEEEGAFEFLGAFEDGLARGFEGGFGGFGNEDVGSAGVGGVAIGSHGEVSFTIPIEIAYSEVIAERVVAGFTRNDDIGGRRGGGDTAIVVEDIGAAGGGGIAGRSDGEVGLAVGIEIA